MSESSIDVNHHPADNAHTEKPTATCSRRNCCLKAILMMLLVIVLALIYHIYDRRILYSKLLQQQAAVQIFEQNVMRQQRYQEQQLTAIKQQLGTGYWSLAEVAYLLKLASFNLQYQQNIPVATQLMDTATVILDKITLAEIKPIQKQVMVIAAQLQSIKPTQLADILSYLNTLQIQVVDLGLPPVERVKVDQAQSMAPKSWREYLQATLAKLKSLVIVRYHDKPMGEQQFSQSYLREQLGILLTQAQWAALRNQEALYQNALQQATIWLKKYFVMDNP